MLLLIVDILKILKGFLEPTEIKGIKRNELLVISTGCQGEEMAAVNRIANHNHPHINVTKGDTIILHLR